MNDLRIIPVNKLPLYALGQSKTPQPIPPATSPVLPINTTRVKEIAREDDYAIVQTATGTMYALSSLEAEALYEPSACENYIFDRLDLLVQNGFRPSVSDYLLLEALYGLSSSSSSEEIPSWATYKAKLNCQMNSCEYWINDNGYAVIDDDDDYKFFHYGIELVDGGRSWSAKDFTKLEKVNS